MKEAAEQYAKELEDADEVVSLIQSLQLEGETFRQALKSGAPDYVVDLEYFNDLE